MNPISKVGILVSICLFYLFIDRIEKNNIKEEEKNEEV